MGDQPNESAVFGETSSSQPTTPVVNMSDTPSSDPVADQLLGIKNESGEQKYANVSSALASIAPANEHISRLEDETRELRDELAKRKTAEEIVAQINPSIPQAVPVGIPPTTDGLNEARVSELVAKQLKQTAAEEKANANLSKVNERLIQHYGDAEKAEAAYNQAAVEAGIGQGFLDGIAAQSPEAVFSLMGLKGTPSGLPEKTSQGESQQPNLSTENLANKPKRSMMYGASSAELREHMNDIKESVMAEYNNN